jgi:transcriptional regulator with XRE-family HTH domain
MMRHIKKTRVAALRAAGLTQAQAAESVGICRDSVSRWERNRDPEYRQAFDRALDNVVMDAYTHALDVMTAELTSTESLERWRASNSILNHAARMGIRVQSAQGQGGPVDIFAVLMPNYAGKPLYIENDDQEALASGPSDVDDPVQVT